MIYEYRGVVNGAFDWIGLLANVDGQAFHVTEGRIGRLDNPLVNVDGGIVGGWYVKETTHTMTPDIEQVDIVLKDDQTYLMFRSADPDEVCPAEYELLLSLAWMEGGVWYSVIPRRDEAYEKTLRT